MLCSILCTIAFLSGGRVYRSNTNVILRADVIVRMLPRCYIIIPQIPDLIVVCCSNTSSGKSLKR